MIILFNEYEIKLKSRHKWEKVIVFFLGGWGATGHIFTQRLSNSYLTWTEHFYPSSDFKLTRSYIKCIYRIWNGYFI